jgi:hypothetical protein
MNPSLLIDNLWADAMAPFDHRTAGIILSATVAPMMASGDFPMWWRRASKTGGGVGVTVRIPVA